MHYIICINFKVVVAIFDAEYLAAWQYSSWPCRNYSFNPFPKGKDISSFLKSNGLNSKEAIYFVYELKDIKASKKPILLDSGLRFY